MSPADAGRTVLVVDDEPDILDILDVLLQGAGYTVLKASHGAEALTHLAAHGAPDVILTDLMMPWMDGVTLVRILAADEARRAIPIIVMTAAPLSVQMRSELVGRTVIKKPLRPETLLAAIEAVVSPA